MDALRTDLYQLTMAAGYFHRGMQDRRATCEMFVRRLPRRRRYLLAMGIERLLGYLENLSFTEDEIRYLRDLPALRDAMTEPFVEYLRRFRFRGDVSAVREGTVVFANEPLVRISAPIIEAQIVETFLLSVVNHATMIGSKAARVVRAAGSAGVIEFGTRRTHPEAAIDAALSAYAAGFVGTSNVEAGKRFGIPVMGTAAHIWTMAHATEEEAFENYVATFPNASILLIDTYDTLRGAERAARIAKDKLKGVRLDSGDLLALSRAVRPILDAAGCTSAKIVASGDLNEYKIEALRRAGAPIDLYGVGTDLVASIDSPALGGVYKLVEIEQDGKVIPICKFSEGKATFPGPHQVYRFVDGAGVLARDVIALADEDPRRLGEGQPEALLVPRMKNGARTEPAEGLDVVRARVARELARLPEALHVLDEAPPPTERTDEPYRAVPSTRLLELVEDVRARVVGAAT
ncbi:nicotinate phosphoribosyltransferase [Polyangium jinanense]|uniref:Nicotinate phosphoribosyltransferase n=1 Tax=Polyangium jinanense TaxID=2829994 RepID=A0A9X3X7E0_9BACT|nr:nicotinate phosphoribosyltransferase [Polyangium jinanense]MDC3957985.1 nicotinate phosphoribosyltransferase [Polyangium jinanense]MDC3983538.1 nicotinate phosphoribosyltransferase [Polyangium jinanense]